MEICDHCHNVLAKSIDRCTVCGTLRADPRAADVRRRESGEAPAHAPGWASAAAPQEGLHPDDFLRELSGETPAAPAAAPELPARAAPTPPATGLLAGYLGSSVERTPPPPAADQSPNPPLGDVPPDPTHDAEPLIDVPLSGPSTEYRGEHLSTATKVTPDGVAARSTRLDGAVKLGPTGRHRQLTIGAPVLSALLLVGGIVGSFSVDSSDAATGSAEANPATVDPSAVAQTGAAVVRLDLDGCGVLDQTTGFLFSDQAILAPRSAVLTDNRPTVVLSDGSTLPAEIVGWSITRDLAVIRADQRVAGGLRWGVSARSRTGDSVSVLMIGGPGAARPAPATITSVGRANGINTSFDLDVSPPAGSVVLNSDGFVIGIIDGSGSAQVSDDVSPAVSRVVLGNERPDAECPPPPPPTTVPAPAPDTESTPADDSAADE
jgi:hypothetical protein